MMEFPTSPAPQSLEITTYQPSREAMSHSGKRFSQTTNVQRWGFKVDYSLLNKQQSAILWATLVAAKGKHKVFHYTPPMYSNTAGNITGMATISYPKNAGRSWVIFRGTKGKLSVGDYIKFSNHDKVYLVLSAANGFIKIEPPLYKSINMTTYIQYNGIRFTVALESSSSSVSFKPPLLGYAQISMIEIV